MQKKVKEMTKELQNKAQAVETALHAKKLAASLAPKSSKKMSVESITILQVFRNYFVTLQQRVISELLSTYESAKVILQFTDSVFCEKMENPKIISICIKLLQLIVPICSNCMQRCDSLLAVDSSDFAKRVTIFFA